MRLIAIKFFNRLTALIIIPRYLTSDLIGMSQILTSVESLIDKSSHLWILRHKPEAEGKKNLILSKAKGT